MKRVILSLLAGLAVLLPVWPAQPARAAAPATPEPIVLHVTTPSYTVDQDGVDVPGYGRDDRPGAPALPVWRTVVELPAGGDWRISYTSSDARMLARAVDVPAMPVPDLAPLGSVHGRNPAELPDAVPTVDRPDPAIYAANAFYPASPVVTGTVQWQRGKRLLPLQVFPFQYNPVTRQLRYHPDVQIVITVSGEDSGQTLPSLPPSPPLPLSLSAPSGALRIRTGERGLYRLTYGDLSAAGVPLASLDPASFAMSYLGQPVAIEVLGEADGSFDPGDLVIFYAQPYQGRFEAKNVYWLSYGGAAGLRMASRATTPTGSEPLVTTITRTLQVEVDVDYRSDFPLPRNADHWFDMPLSPDDLAASTVTRSYTLPVIDPLPGGVARVQVALHGGANRPANPDKSVAIALNSHAVTLHQWEGMTYTISDDVVSSDWLDGAPNRIHLTASTAQLPGIGFYSVSPDWVRLTYPSLASAQGDRLYIEAMAAGALQASASGFSTPAVRVYELRDPNRPLRLLTTAAQPAGGGYTVSFWDEDLPGPTYFLSSLAALSAPAAVELDTPSSWRTPDHQADYIAIVHPSLWSAIDPLLAHRAAEGLAVAKVDVQDIYDEWSYGRRDPEAIRSFLTYAYRCWNSGPCAPPPAQPANPPRYVLLVGDGHYDFTGVSGTTLPNLIPPYLLQIDPWLGETAADNRYVSVDGPDDYLPEMAIGRIPATSPADVTAVVDKIIAYETAAPGGDWQKRVVFVADNNLDQAGNFHVYSDEVRLNWLPAGYDSQTIYYNRDYFSAATMRTAIKAAFNADALLLQWFGHGSRFRWGSVSMFNSDDPATLAANDTWPMTVAYSCWSGYFVNLFGGWQSLGETLLLTPQRGSVADLSPSGLHVGAALLTLNQGLTDVIFRQRIQRAGLAVDAAKLYYFGQASGFHDVIDTSIFFGDPALKLRLSDPLLAGATLDASRAWAPSDLPVTFTATLAGRPGDDTAAQLTLTLPAELGDPTALGATSSTAVYDPVSRQVTWSGVVLSGGTEVITFDSALLPGAAACSQAVVAGQVQDGLAATIPLSVAVQAVTPDVDCDGAVDIVDIQLVTARWGAAQGDPLYHPRYDLDGDDAIGVLDIVLAAAAWN